MDKDQGLRVLETPLGASLFLDAQSIYKSLLFSFSFCPIWMCFPGKRQKNILSDASSTPKPDQKPINQSPAAAAPASSTPAPAPEPVSTAAPVPEITTTEPAFTTTMSSPGSPSSSTPCTAISPSNRGDPARVRACRHACPAQARLPHSYAGGAPNFDAFIFGIPTRYGNFPAQWKAFWDATGGLWAQGKLAGKYASVFVSTGTPGGGQETTVISSLSTLTHHGIIFVPLGYSKTFPQLANLSEVRGGTFAAADGSRQPTALELELAKIQGEHFHSVVSKVKF
ncbi:Protoplast secreted protein 2 [Grifola frondosa]|uniref:Protoplast secreted protein 2 n=1 Tax=Grifola frondosa TaxID=5627 RepID=A0A1C7MK71_GRIFR|nr:Protoplast secreted protein 2 [Grifola frondosa]